MLVQHGLERRATAALVRSDSIADALGGLPTPPRRRVETVSPLTKREQELAMMAARGLTSKEIAAELVLSVRTVETHLQRSYMKLGIQGRGELADALGLN
jgi:DNA-binding CsgD family transcriptional regulator